MAVTARIVSSDPRGSEFKIEAEYTVNGVAHLEYFRASNQSHAESIIKSRIALLETPPVITPGAVVVPPPPTPKPPTPEELALAAWLVLLNDWKLKKSALGVSKTVTQQDVDAAYAAMKTDYIDAYAPFLVGAL